MKTLLWLDDARDPTINDWINFSPIGKNVDIIWVTSFQEFIDYISINGLPDGICFDHDLGEELTGYDCASWLIEYCLKYKKQIPPYNIQSANVVGKQRIDSLLKDFDKFLKSI